MFAALYRLTMTVTNTTTHLSSIPKSFPRMCEQQKKEEHRKTYFILLLLSDTKSI